MREIKFRAWDEQTKWMINPVAVYEGGSHIGFYAGRGITIPFDEDELPGNMEYGENDWFYVMGLYQLMQYTGRSDDKEAEIYEGDIVRGSAWGDMNIGVVVWWEPTGQWAVKYNGENSFDELYLFLEIEVIGNIYEHPELLEATP